MIDILLAWSRPKGIPFFEPSWKSNHFRGFWTKKIFFSLEITDFDVRSPPPPFLSKMLFRYIVPFCERENSFFIKLETCFLLWCTSYFLLHVMYAWVQIYLCITMQNMLAHAMFLTLFQKIEDLCLKNVPFSWFRQFAPKAQTEGGCLIRRAVPSDTSHWWINLNLLTQVTCLSCWQPRTVKNVSGELS